MEPAVVVIILADDLIWASRLSDLVTAAGATPLRVRSLAEFGAVLPVGGATIIDLTARAYDGVAAVEMAAHVDARILCVGQHDDRELRRRALDAGAQQVLPYRAVFERGPALVARWLHAPDDAAHADLTDDAAATDTQDGSDARHPTDATFPAGADA